MNEGAATPAKRSFTIRAIVGSAVTALGIALLLLGLFGDIPDTAARLSTIGLGAVVVILGAYVLSAVAVTPASRIIGAPFALAFGAAGKLAQRNAGRDPRRVSATSAAIMVGIALITLVSVFAASISGTIDEILDTGIDSDLIVGPTSTFDPTAGFSESLANEVESVPEVSDTSLVQQGPAIIVVDEGGGLTGETEIFVGSVEENATGFFDVTMVEGVAYPSEDGIVVDVGTAADNEWVIGSQIQMLFEATGFATIIVEGIAEGTFSEGFTMSRDGFVKHFDTTVSQSQFVQLADGVSPEEGKAAVEQVTQEVPTVQVQTLEEFQDAISGQINSLLGLFTGLLALTVIIALIGVTNTMTLAVHERTREIGLLRAVGLDRTQTRGMILSEASIIAAFGATLGVILGIAFAWAVLRALADDGFSAFVIPVVSLVIWVGATAILAVIFALWPSRRAARLNILDAISYE